MFEYKKEAHKVGAPIEVRSLRIRAKGFGWVRVDAPVWPEASGVLEYRVDPSWLQDHTALKGAAECSPNAQLQRLDGRGRWVDVDCITDRRGIYRLTFRHLRPPQPKPPAEPCMPQPDPHRRRRIHARLATIEARIDGVDLLALCADVRAELDLKDWP